MSNEDIIKIDDLHELSTDNIISSTTFLVVLDEIADSQEYREEEKLTYNSLSSKLNIDILDNVNGILNNNYYNKNHINNNYYNKNNILNISSLLNTNIENVSTNCTENLNTYKISVNTEFDETNLKIDTVETTINSQKVTVFSDLSAYVDDVLSSDTVNFPTAAAITLWSDKRYLRSVGFADPTEPLALLSSMLQKSNLNVYCDSYNGNDENSGLDNKYPVKTLTKAILIVNKRRFIAGSLIYIYLTGTFNIREEANIYFNANKKDEEKINISDSVNTTFHNNYRLLIYHPDMIAPSYIRIRSKNNDLPAEIVADLNNTNKWQIAITVFCDTIFENIKFIGCIPKLYNPNTLLSISAVSSDISDDISCERYNIIEPKYSKITSAYNKNNINESFFVASQTDYVDFYNCSCYNCMTAFSLPNLVKNCYFENVYRCIETNKANKTEIQGLSCYDAYSITYQWLNGILYLANAEEYLTLDFRNLREFVTPTNTGFNILFNLYFSYVGYYNKDTLRLEDRVNGKPVNRITDNYNIYKYCSSYVCPNISNGKTISVEHTTVDYVDFVNTFIYGEPPKGGDISAKYQNFRNKYGGILTFACGDYATSSIIYTKLKNVDPDNPDIPDSEKNRDICYFPFLELLFNIIREDVKTLTSYYNGTEYSTTYKAYKISDIVHLNDNNKVSSIDYTKFTISAYKDLFDSIY